MQSAPTLEDALEVVSALSAHDKLRLMQKMMTSLEHDLAPEQAGMPKPSLLGLWSGITVSTEDIDDARAAMMRNFPREDI